MSGGGWWWVVVCQAEHHQQLHVTAGRSKQPTIDKQQLEEVVYVFSKDEGLMQDGAALPTYFQHKTNGVFLVRKKVNISVQLLTLAELRFHE